MGMEVARSMLGASSMEHFNLEGLKVGQDKVPGQEVLGQKEFPGDP